MRSYNVSNDRLGMLHGLTQNDAPSHPLTRDPQEPDPSQQPRSPPNASRGSDGEKSRATSVEESREEERHRKNKFRFKKKRRSGGDEEKRERRHRHHHHHRESESSSRPSKRRRHSHERKKTGDDPSAYDDTYLPNVSSTQYADPDEAFRQSLFDAMADDEGAAFWEGVYGEPINNYPRPQVKNERGMLEQMDDEEYAAYVREKMWEKSHQHIVEERERRGREKEEKKRREREERIAWEHAEKEIQREDKQRRQRKHRSDLQKRWDEYLHNWARIADESRVDVDNDGGERKVPLDNIPWPTRSGKLLDLSQDAIEEFFLSAPTGTAPNREGFTDMLKLERVRWHPDKAQQRWGKSGLSEEELKGITAVFQAIDSLWIKNRKNKSTE